MPLVKDEPLTSTVDLSYHDDDGYWLTWSKGDEMDQSVQSWQSREEGIEAFVTGAFSWKTTRPWERGWRPLSG